MPKLYNIGAKHGESEVIFHLRGISVAEENRFTARFAAISDLDSEEVKASQEYEILVDALASWSEKEPTIKEAGAVVTNGSSESPGAGVRAYFDNHTNEKERTAQQVVLQFRRKLQPEVVFY